MTREARLTQKRLEGEILGLLEGESARLYKGTECAYCAKYKRCRDCPFVEVYPDEGFPYGCMHPDFKRIANDMEYSSLRPDAIPGALAIYMWLFEL